jgi:hypothetical protein
MWSGGTNITHSDVLSFTYRAALRGADKGWAAVARMPLLVIR